MSPLFSGETRSLEWAMEPDKCSEFVYGILALLAWMTHTDPKKILPFQTPRKNGQTTAGMGARGCFLTPATKASHKPVQAGQRGDLALSAVNLQDFFFFGIHSHSPFLCLCGAVFVQVDPPLLST